MITILQGDCLEKLRELPDNSVHCCVCSPPYWGLRDYGVAGQIGLEKTPEEYVAKMVEVFREVKRVLRSDGTCWINLGDSYWSNQYTESREKSLETSTDTDGVYSRRIKRNTGIQHKRESATLKPKDLVGIPWRVAFALQADGWYLRSDIIWHKPNPMPESVTDRPTKAHEYIFLLAKSERYFYDAEAIKEPSSPDSHARAAAGYNHAFASQFRGSPTDHRFPNGKRIPGVTPKSQPAGNGVKANESFHAAVTDLVTSRNKRTVWTVGTDPYPEAHFATYPPDLIKPCILAGTSARGCCPKCGAPWERVTQHISGYDGSEYGKRVIEASGGAKTGGTAASTLGSPNGKLVGRTETVNWQPTCKCSTLWEDGDGVTYLDKMGPFEPIPCTVLDPFAGSGTTGEVALELGRKAILVELNPKYVKLIERRTAVTPGLQLA